MPNDDSSAEPKLAIVNARVSTGDPRRPWADAVLVRDAEIQAVGSSADIRKRVDGRTRIIDAGGLTVTRALPSVAIDAVAPPDLPLAPLTAGTSADLQLLDGASATARVVLTIIAGRIVYEREATES